jgi:pilus assembly protein Flp/PilA
MRALLRKLAADRSGATAIEYGLIAAFIAIALVASLPSIRSNLQGLYGNVNTDLAAANKASKG